MYGISKLHVSLYGSQIKTNKQSKSEAIEHIQSIVKNIGPKQKENLYYLINYLSIALRAKFSDPTSDKHVINITQEGIKSYLLSRVLTEIHHHFANHIPSYLLEICTHRHPLITPIARYTNSAKKVIEILDRDPNDDSLLNATENYLNSNFTIAEIIPSQIKRMVMQLCGNNFSQITLQISNFTNADFSGLNLSRLNFTNATFTGANLQQANLSRAILKGSSFSHANLEDANLSETNLKYADFSNANLKNINLANAILANTNFTNANLLPLWNGLARVNFTSTNLDNVTFNLNFLSGIETNLEQGISNLLISLNTISNLELRRLLVVQVLDWLVANYKTTNYTINIVIKNLVISEKNKSFFDDPTILSYIQYYCVP